MTPSLRSPPLPARGGIGIIRLSGSLARFIAEPILRIPRPLAAGQARFAELVDPSSLVPGHTPVVLDQAVVTFFAAPHSYTSDDVVEISLHGSRVLLQAVLQYALSQGARLAEPGEFTQRAFLSGRLDLTRAEAVRDLIDASTLHQARVAAAQLGGSVSKSIAPIKSSLITLIATLEAGIDFAEDDLETLPSNELLRRLDGILQSPMSSFGLLLLVARLEKVSSSLWQVKPNAGKSSLFNRLLGQNRAIVTAQPGTTRDPITERFAVAGIPVELIDTAGLRELTENATNEAEIAGIERARFTIAEAHHVLLVVDAMTIGLIKPELLAESRATLGSLSDRPFTIVLNKTDLLTPEQHDRVAKMMPQAVLVSATRGNGIEQLRSSLEGSLVAEPPSAEATLVTSVRQQNSIANAHASVAKACLAIHHSTPHEMILLDLYAALGVLDELTGDTTSNDVLNLVFSTFCIGK